MSGMGDDPARDLPVKEVTTNTGQPLAGLTKQTAASHILRYDSEDHYLTLRQENDELKMRLHKQDDKMKRLATKLMRLMSEQKQRLGSPEARRALELQTIVAEQAERIDELQSANSMLQERVSVMRRQLMEQGRLRARIPGYVRGPATSTASTPRRKKPPAADLGKQAETPEPSKDAELERLQSHITHLEQEKAGLGQRLEELELQKQRCQVGENVELIRLRRSLAQQASQMATLEERAQAAERDHAQARQALTAAQRDLDGVQQQRNLLKKRALDLEGELQSLQAERWKTLELEVAVKDLQRERDVLQGQNARLLVMVEERAARSQELHDQQAHAARLEQRLADEAAQRVTLLGQLHAVEEELVKAKSQAVNLPLASDSCRNSNAGDKENSLLSQVGRLEADLAREMKERVDVLQMLEKLHNQQNTVIASRAQSAQPEDRSVVEQSRQTPCSPSNPQRRPELQTSTSFHELQEACRPAASARVEHLAAAGRSDPTSESAVVLEAQQKEAADFRSCHSVGCLTEAEWPASTAVRLDKCVQVGLDERQGYQLSSHLQRVPSLEQSKFVVMSRAPQGTALRIPTLAESARIPDEPQSEATDADLSLLCEKSQGEVSSESIDPCIGSERCSPDKSQGEVTSKNQKPFVSSYVFEKSQGEVSDSVSSDKPSNPSYQADKSQDKVTSSLEGGCVLPNDKFSAADHLETVHELEKCRDLLRVQCDINSSLKEQVIQLRQRLAQIGAGHAKQLAELRRKLEEQAAPGREPRTRTPRALFEFHIDSLQLCSEMMSGRGERNLYLSWVFCDQDVSCTSPCPAQPSIHFEYTVIYQVSITHSFLSYLQNEECQVELYSLTEQGSQLEGRGSLRFAELLRFPQNRLHATVSQLSPDGLTSVGNVHCWFRLACDVGLPLSAEGSSGSSQPIPASSALVPAQRIAFPFSLPVDSEGATVPIPAPRTSIQSTAQNKGSDSAPNGGEGKVNGEGSVKKMKQLADSVLRQVSMGDYLVQFLDQKWQEQKLAGADQLVHAGLSLPSPVREHDNTVGVTQRLELWLDHLRLMEDSEVMRSEDAQQFQVECSFPSQNGPVTVASPSVHKHDAVNGQFALDFHTSFSLGRDGGGGEHHLPTLQDVDAGELCFLINSVPMEGGDLQLIGSASADVLRMAYTMDGQAELRLDVINPAGKIVGELGVQATLRKDS